MPSLNLSRLILMRCLIAGLTLAAATFAALNEVASLDRFAAERLHFPDGLSWTLPGMITVATVAGALMWTVLREVPLRRAGRRLNIVCAAISAAAVGLDHMAGAVGYWMIPAFAVGALVPTLATWLTHLLARLTDATTQPAVEPSQRETPMPAEPEPAEPEPAEIRPRPASLTAVPPRDGKTETKSHGARAKELMAAGVPKATAYRRAKEETADVATA